MEDFRPLQIKHYLIFTVANQMYAVDILDIESVHVSTRKSPDDDIEDQKMAVRLHKRVIPIINLRKKYRLQGGEDNILPSLIFIKHIEGKIVSILGLQVDQTLEIVETLVPRKANGKSNRLIKAFVGLKMEIVPVLSYRELIKNEVLYPIETGVLN